MQAEQIANDTSMDWNERVRAMAEVLHKKPQEVARRKIHIACEELDFVWDVQEICDFRRMWDEGKSVIQMACVLERDPDEILILAIDQCKEGYITQRQGGLLGRMA